MKSLAILIAALAVLAFQCAAAPMERIETDPELTAGYFQGDIVLDSNSRNGYISEALKWPNKVVYYRFYQDQMGMCS